MPCEYFILIRRQRRPCLLANDGGLRLAGQYAGRGWHCDTLQTSDFVDDVMFSNNGLMARHVYL